MRGVALWMKTCFAFGFLGTFVRSAEVPGGLTEIKSIDLHRSVKAHFHLLGECRRHLTFLTSLALGAFITKVLKDSPLTPLPLPPLPDTLHWNLVSLPAHMVGHNRPWVLKHPAAQQVVLNQGFAGLARSSPSESWTKSLIRFRRNLSREWRSSPNLIYSAVQRTLKPLKFIIPHAIGMQNWLLRWCH